MNFGLDFEKLLVIGLIALLILGPERLPAYAEKLAKLLRRAGELLRETRTRVSEEMGEDVADVDWRKLDPRQYDPRRIIRDALFEEPMPAATATIAEPVVAPKPVSAPMPRTTPAFSLQNPPPFDSEAT